VDLAYATVGQGPDLEWAYGLMTHLEVKWEEPSLAAMLRRRHGLRVRAARRGVRRGGGERL